MWNKLKAKMTSFLLPLLGIRPMFDPRQDPELVDVAQRQDQAIQKILSSRGVDEGKIFDLITTESWASPEDIEYHQALQRQMGGESGGLG